MRTAFMVDGGFFLKRIRVLMGSRPPARVAKALSIMCHLHLRHKERSMDQLYRIFVYDCPPLTNKAHNPVSKQSIDFSKTITAQWRYEFHEELRRIRKVALRLGYLNARSAYWTLQSGILKDLLSGDIGVADLKDTDVKYEVRQKSVDMKMGLDIASLAYKRLVDQIVLVAGDSDFVPAAKLARREGIDFILDPMWSNVRHDLTEHIDGLHSAFRRKRQQQHPTQSPAASSP